MEGQTLSHYKVLEKLGGGGMGVVYKALDTKLNRHVALKFLPPELTRDDDARERFILEAQAASALDHPNICTIHEIDATPEGQQFIAMAYYEGETLKKRISQGPLPVDEALDVAIQIAQGLQKAHQAGIIHRDIKPANVMLTTDGFVKIVDFGIAKLLGVTGPTQTGTTLGTVSYMSPEQVAGEDADRQSDVWALGTVLYEMLTGQQAFKGEHPWAVMNAIKTTDPASPSSLRREIPESVEGVVTSALEKPKEHRYPSITDFLSAAKEAQAALSQPVAALNESGSWTQTMFRPRFAGTALAAIAVLGAVGLWVTNRGADARWVREEAVPEIARLIAEEQNVRAFLLAQEALEILPDDPGLQGAWDAVSWSVPTVSEPPGADVYWRDYADPGGEWYFAGQTPLDSLRVPFAYLRWRFTRDGFRPVEQAGYLVPAVQLAPENEGSDGMVFIPASEVDLGGGSVELGAYWLDTFEATNGEYQAFVDALGAGHRHFCTGGVSSVK